MNPPRSDAALQVELEFVRKEDAGDPFGFRFTAQEYLGRSTEGEYESASLSWDGALMSELLAVHASSCDPALLPRLGERLRRFVTPLGWGSRRRKSWPRWRTSAASL